VTHRPEQAKEFYDEVWRKYAHLDAKSPAAFHRRRLVVQLVRNARPDARRILDVGCGQGELLGALQLAMPEASVDGADVSEQSLTDSRKRSPNGDLFILDLSDADFEEKYRDRLGLYDVVTCSEVIEHIPDDARALKRLHALLAPRGAAIVTVPGGKMSRFDEIIGHHRHYAPARLERLLTAQGFSVEAVLAWGFPFHSVYRTAVRVASRAAMPNDPATGDAEANRTRGIVGSVLGRAYGLFGRGLQPLFYLNLSRWGEQILAVARRSA